MKRKITISIPTNDPDVDINITPIAKDVVVIESGVPKFALDANQLKEAIVEAEKYRLEFEQKEKQNTKEVKLEGTPLTFIVENE